MGVPIRRGISLPSVQCDAPVSWLADPGEMPCVGSPAFPLYLSARGEGRRMIVEDATARAGRYAGGWSRYIVKKTKKGNLINFFKIKPKKGRHFFNVFFKISSSDSLST